MAIQFCIISIAEIIQMINARKKVKELTYIVEKLNNQNDLLREQNKSLKEYISGRKNEC